MLFYRLLEQSVAMHPISYRDLVANPKPRKEKKGKIDPCRHALVKVRLRLSMWKFHPTHGVVN
jgi:hypothetical protein